MRNFLKIADGVDVGPVIHALTQHPDLWDENPLRTMHPGTAHAEVNDIWLWFNDIDMADLAKVVDDKDVIPYRGWSVLPQVRPIVLNLMRAVEGIRLGRVMITRLAPGKRILPHADGGAPAEYFSRYHVALKCPDGALFRAGDEIVQMRTGEAWWFNNRAEHEVWNHSTDDRIVLIIDVRTA